MKLFYCEVPHGNFGDDLNTYLWPRLLPGAFDGTVKFWPQEPKAFSRFDPGDTLFVGIGSLILDRMPPDVRKVVFGAGTIEGKVPQLDKQWVFHCVRGPLTANALGLPHKLAIADPAILVRLLPPAAEKPIHRVSFMPHYTQAQSGMWQSICRLTGIHFIDPRWPPRTVLHDIAASDVLISEALHGAIVADALRVPWVAVSSRHHIQSFKWRDWCSSIGERYEPVNIPALWTPRPGLAGKAVSRMKMMQGAMVLTGLAHRVRLSEYDVINRLTVRLTEKLEEFARARGLALELAPHHEDA